MLSVLLNGSVELTVKQSWISCKDNLADPDLRPLVDIKDHIQFVLSFLINVHLDFAGLEALL